MPSAGSRTRRPQTCEQESILDGRMHDLVCAYDLAENGTAFPSQALLAKDLGVARETVNRSIKRLERAEKLIIRKRWSWRSGWQHNVYELLEPPSHPIPERVRRRIVRRAHKRRWLKARVARGEVAGKGPDHTNCEAVGSCRCRSCQPRRQKPVRPGSHWLPLPEDRFMRDAVLDCREMLAQGYDAEACFGHLRMAAEIRAASPRLRRRRSS
jgi:DNA-binding transcriptional MocR family regulator